jgi:hypothetical protein
MIIRVAHGMVTASRDTRLLGLTFDEVQQLAKDNRGFLCRVAESRHACVDQPALYCAACDGPEPMPNGLWEVRGIRTYGNGTSPESLVTPTAEQLSLWPDNKR